MNYIGSYTITNLIQAKGFSQIYINNPRVCFHLKLYKSIGFVPLGSIDSAFMIIGDSMTHLISTEKLPSSTVNMLEEYHEYIRSTWLNRTTYSRELWKHYCLLTDRTNNNNEGFNNMFWGMYRNHYFLNWSIW